MQSIRLPFFLVTSAILATGCGNHPTPTGVQNDQPTITVNDLVGSWRATSELFKNSANSSQTFDLIANGGEHRFTMLADGGARTWFDFGDFHDEWDAQVTLNGDTETLTSTPVEAPRPVRHATLKLEGHTLTLTSTDLTFG